MPLTTVDKAAALARVPLFQGISDDSMARLAEVTAEIDFDEGQFIVLQGQVGTGLYVIMSGKARVIRGSDELAEFGPTDFFGELAVIDQAPRSASVQAVVPTSCLALASWDLLDLLETDPKLSLNMMRELVQRLREFGVSHRH